MKKTILISLALIMLIAGCDFLNGIYDKIEYTTWSITSNLAVTGGLRRDKVMFRNIQIYNGYIYIAGMDESFGTLNDWQWRIEKRDCTTGALVPEFEDHTSYHETGGAGVIPGIVQFYVPLTNTYTNFQQIIVDSGSLFAIGGNWFRTPDRQNWRVEKRNLHTGKLIPDFGGGVVEIDPNNAQNDSAFGACVDSDYIYITGIYGGGTSDWWTEKNNKSTGAKEMSFGGVTGYVRSNLSTGYSQPAAGIILDSDYIYIGGHDFIPGDSQCRVEKRNKTSGALISGFGSGGIFHYDTSATDDRLVNMVIDGDYLYLCGYIASSSAKAIVIKIDKNNGLPVSNFGTSGVVTKSSSDHCYYNSILIDGNMLLLAGSQYFSAFPKGMIERLNKSTGAPDASFGTGGTVLDDTANQSSFLSAALDEDYMFVAGTYVDFGGDTKIYIQKRRKDTGGF